MRFGVTPYKDRWRVDVLAGSRAKRTSIFVGVFADKEEAQRVYETEQAKRAHYLQSAPEGDPK